MSSSTITVTAENFAEEVEQSEIPVLVDFWAEWCGPCRAIGPLLEEIGSEHAGAYKIAKVDVDAQRDLAAKFEVRSIPLLLFFKDGEVKDKVVGAGTSKQGLIDKLSALA